MRFNSVIVNCPTYRRSTATDNLAAIIYNYMIDTL